VLNRSFNKALNRIKKKTMFTVEQIKAAHARVKSGADFPAYIRDLKQMGVTAYTTWVMDGHTEYFGENNFRTQSKPMYGNMKIAGTSDRESFQQYLKNHQQGKSDYPAFCNQCAETGVEKWVVSLDAMTCTYYDNAGKNLLVEAIPQ
jgi:uncharacterized protein YbcV (DUF1398 family)